MHVFYVHIKTPQFFTKTYIPPFSNPIINEGQWYTKTGGEAKNDIKAVQLGLIKPNQLAKSFDQLEDEMRRLFTRSFAEMPRKNRGHLALVPRKPRIEQKYWKDNYVPRRDTQLKEETLTKKKERKFFL